ncbi:MAG: SDR family NAD(P)-dependent oxidoreductase [Acetobacteraceae bacterium]
MSQAFDLGGSRVLIAGAASGIGAAAAAACASMGATAILADVADCRGTAAIIHAAGGHAEVSQCDITDRSAVEALVAAHVPLDAMVASAAICPWDDWNDARWDETFARVIATDLLGPIHLCRAVLPQMAARGGGRIVLVGSLAGRSGGLIAGAHYVAAKGGLHAFVRWLARRAAPQRVLVNAVAPASVKTPMMQGQPVDLARIPLGRMAEPEEVGWPIAFLCSRAASFITGVVLDVNGGVLMA